MGNLKPENIFNMNKMEEGLQNYDVLIQKYFWDMENVSAQMLKQAMLLESRHAVPDRKWDIDKAQNAYETVRKIYGDDMLNYLRVIQLADDKFIENFVGIEGIDRLFQYSYFYFEWMMHLEYNKERRDYSYYRDHYVHQIKNMYEMLTLLDEHGFMEKSIDIYQKSTGVVAEYIRKSVKEQIRCVDQDERALFESVMQYKIENEEMTRKEASEKLPERIEECYYRYILHSASIIAALVHDIGYPINFMLRISKTLHEFLPLSESFLHINDAMPHLEEILKSSLLYKTVDPNQIAERVRFGHDHGAISAVMLLSQYYEAGAIYHLRPIERMAIELAALVIYNHTLRYEYMTGKKEDLYRNVFDENPISYLFRLCDDIQEWGRVYFDISNKSNFLICPNCHMPITKSTNYKGAMEYTCLCGKLIDKQTRFSYRKLTHITACKSVTICGEINDKKEPLVIRMEYDPVTLLQLSYYSPLFAKQRSEGIYEVKRMLDNQDSLPPIYVDTFLTNNPIAIKVKCLEYYLEQIGKRIYKTGARVRNNFMNAYAPSARGKEEGEEKKSATERKNAKQYIISYMNKIEEGKGSKWGNIRGILAVETISKALKMKFQLRENPEYVKDKLQKNLYFYYCLAVIGNSIEAWRKDGNSLSREESIDMARQLATDIADIYKIQDRPIKVLIMDYVLLRWRHISQEELLLCKDSEKKLCYYEMGLSNQFIMDMVKEYVGSDAYSKIKVELSGSGVRVEALEGIYDFYTDYELFALMAEYNCCS